jgi:hypothetical protein
MKIIKALNFEERYFIELNVKYQEITDRDLVEKYYHPYYINDNEYYYGGGNWFIFQNDDWNSTSEPEHTGDIGDYYQGDYYYSSSDYTDIRDSSVYDSDWDNTSSSSSSWESSSSSSSSDDWDYDSDWDSGDSWDSGSSDWGSDW